MPFKRREEPTSIEQEREALREQYAALEDLKRQLAERIDAVREREVELHHALADVGSDAPPTGAPVLPPPVPTDAEADTGEDALEAARREQALLAREHAVAERERAISEKEALLVARADELDAQPAPAPAATLPAPDPDEERLATIEARLAELREAEKLFLRTRDELSDRSETVAARERLVSQREREIDEREDALDGTPSATGISGMEERLRRLEQQQQQPAGEQTLGFSGGLRKLEQGTRQQRPR